MCPVTMLADDSGNYNFVFFTKYIDMAYSRHERKNHGHDSKDIQWSQDQLMKWNHNILFEGNDSNMRGNDSQKIYFY